MARATTDPTFVYTSATGSFAFDADGADPGAAVTLAILGSLPATMAAAFVLG